MTFTYTDATNLALYKAKYDQLNGMLTTLATSSAENFTYSFYNSGNQVIMQSTTVVTNLGWDISNISNLVKNAVIAQINTQLETLTTEMLALGFDVTQSS